MRRLAPVLATFLASACAVEVGEAYEPEHENEEEETALFESAYEETLGLDLEYPEGIEDIALDDAPAATTTIAASCSGVRVPDQPGFGKRIALTFDDGPNPLTTPKVIQVLKKHNAPATFFTNGSRYANTTAKALAAKIAADPLFVLANHSQNHLNLALQTATKVASEVSKTDSLIRAAGEQPVYFRFPYGSATCSNLKQVRAKGYIVVGWHIDSADWCYAAGGGVCKASTFKYVPDSMRSNMLAYVRSQARANAGGIVLFHDVHANTANKLDAILTALKADGFTFVRLTNKNVFPKLNATL